VVALGNRLRRHWFPSNPVVGEVNSMLARRSLAASRI
jgi:hypothetical protein